MPRTCTKTRCPAQASRPCADCDETVARATPKQARPADPLDFKVAALLSVGHDVALAHQLTDAEFKAAFALFKRAAAARRARGAGR